MALSGPAGSGKTYTLLRLATELGGPIAIADTEHGSASKYADLFTFDVVELSSFDPLIIPELIQQAAAHGYRSLLIDSLSHFWNGVDGELDQVDKITARSKSSNSWAAWRSVSPKHNAMVDAMTAAPIHVLCSMRVKTEWVVERDEKGKSVPRAVGLQPIMRDGIEYEFDVCGEMDQENTLVITKSRCPRLTGAVIPKPGAETADVLKEWLIGAPGAAVSPNRTTPPSAAGPPANVGVDRSTTVPPPLIRIWEQMTTSEGAVAQIERLKENLLLVTGPAGAADYQRVLQTFGVTTPAEFKSSRPARLCAKDLFLRIAELADNGSEVDEPQEADDAN
ncbi:MAG: ATP-binding protein [Bryobacteraceae bacterium]